MRAYQHVAATNFQSLGMFQIAKSGETAYKPRPINNFFAAEHPDTKWISQFFVFMPAYEICRWKQRQWSWILDVQYSPILPLFHHGMLECMYSVINLVLDLYRFYATVVGEGKRNALLVEFSVSKYPTNLVVPRQLTLLFI